MVQGMSVIFLAVAVHALAPRPMGEPLTEVSALESLTGCDPSWPTLVLSDIDDTLLSSDAQAPAGCDSDFGHKVIYPGVAQFYLELAGGSGAAGSGERQSSRQA